MKPIHWLLLVAVAVIVALILLWPDTGPSPAEQEREAQYQRQQAIDAVKLRESASTIDSLKKKLIDTLKVVIVESEAKDKEIRVLRTRLAKSRTEVQPMLDTIPTLKAFVEQQDSLIQLQDEQIVVLRDGLYQVGKDLTSLIGEQEMNSRIAADMLQQCETRREEMKSEFDKENKKIRRANRVWKVATVVGVVGAFLLAK